MKQLIISLLILIGILSSGWNTGLSEFDVSVIKRHLNDIEVVITQEKPKDNNNPQTPYCTASIRVFKNNKIVDSLIFSDIEPVGGEYGLLVYDEIINNHIVISKYGDYDGLTIMVNDMGNIFKTIGGISAVDIESGLIFSIYYSDQSGISVFNLNSDSEIIELVDLQFEPRKFYKAFSNRYFISGYEMNDGIWEIEFSENRIVQVDLILEEVNSQELHELYNYEELNINCK